MRTEEEQRELLSRLIAIAKAGQEAGETEWLEMKTNISESHASITYDRVGEYISGLSNGACIHYKDFGYLVLGVQDGTWDIVGTNLRMMSARYKQQDYELWLRNNIDPRIVHFGIEDFDWDENRHIVIFEIPAAQGVPTSFKDVEYIRIGSNLTKLKNFPELIRQIYNSTYDWSADIVRGATIEDLDPEAIAEARVRYADKHPHLAEAMKSWSDREFLDKAKVTRNGQITNAAIVLLGKSESESMISPAQTRLKWILKDSKGKDRDYAIECCPMILSIDKIYRRIRNLTFRRINPALQTLTPDEMPTYEPYVLRESISNAIAHQDYMQHGVVNVVEYEDKVVISNLGTFIPGSLKNVLAQSGPQEKYHNPFLVAAMVELKLVDTIGSGIPNICGYQKTRLFPMPVYELEDGRVVLTIYGKVMSEWYARILATARNLSLLDMELLNRVQLHKAISEEEREYLVRRGWYQESEVAVDGPNEPKDDTKDDTKNDTKIDLSKLTERQHVILLLMRENGAMTISKMIPKLRVSKSTILRDLKAMRKLGVLDRDGESNGGKWVLLV